MESIFEYLKSPTESNYIKTPAALLKIICLVRRIQNFKYADNSKWSKCFVSPDFSVDWLFISQLSALRNFILFSIGDVDWVHLHKRSISFELARSC